MNKGAFMALIISTDQNRSIAADKASAPKNLRASALDPNFWYPLARASRLKRGQTLGVTFAGEPICLVRGESGAVYALEDRCAHRQVPLHKGVVKGDRLQCNYHCWTFDKTGRCVSVPYLDDDKRQPTQVRAYPCREEYGFLWVYPGDLDRRDDATFPDIPAFADPAYKTRFLDRRIGCHWSFMHENLMDMNHQFLHRQLMGKIKASLTDVREGDGWVEAEYTFARLSGRQSFGEKIMVGDLGGRDKGDGEDYMVIRTSYPYQTLQFYLAGKPHPALDLWNFYMPVDHAQRENQTYGLMMIRRPETASWLLEPLWPLVVWFTESIFAEDKDIVEQEQAAHDSQGADWNNEVFPPIIALKRLLTEKSVSFADARRAVAASP